MAGIERLGLIINPIAGMGGKVALKGTDGAETLSAARARGAKPEAEQKAARAMKQILRHKDSLLVLTASGEMGQTLCEKLGLPYSVVYTCEGITSAEDTISAAKAIAAQGANLLLFAGGDGTARNVCQAIGERVPAIGIPAGVKIQSAVFALSPERAGTLVSQLIEGASVSAVKREVVDLDEDAYRAGLVRATMYGTLLVPDQPDALQSMKQSGFSSEQDQLHGISRYLKERLKEGIYYAVGPGSTAKCLMQRMALDYELLGVDIICDGRVVVRDATEEQLWKYAKEGNLNIIVSPIGGQGFLFGRGNHQFSPRVLKAVGKSGVTVIAPQSKLLSFPKHRMHIDCGDEEVRVIFSGYCNVLCGYGCYHSLKCE